MQKKRTASPHGRGKGEKAGQEPTRPVATLVLCIPEVESSCKPATKREGGPSEPEGRTIEACGDAGCG